MHEIYAHTVFEPSAKKHLPFFSCSVKKEDPVGTMLHRRRSCRKKQLRQKLLVRDAEATTHEASVL